MGSNDAEFLEKREFSKADLRRWGRFLCDMHHRQPGEAFIAGTGAQVVAFVQECLCGDMHEEGGGA